MMPVVVARRRNSRPRTRLLSGAAAGLTLLALTACSAPDPSKELTLSDLETYWVIQSAAGSETYIAPAVRFRIKNAGTRARRVVYLSAAFRRVGHKEEWGSGWARLPERGQVFAPGDVALVVMAGDQGRYHSPGSAERMFTHAEFVDAQVEVFAQMGGSPQTKLAEARIARRIGAQGVQELLR